MKISYPTPTSVRIEMGHGEEMAAAAKMIAEFGTQVTVELVLPADPPPASAARLLDAEETIAEVEPVSAYVKPESPAARLISAHSTRRKLALEKVGAVYVTANQAIIIDLLRAAPDGLSTRDMALIRHADELAPYADDPVLHEERLVLLIRTLSGYVGSAIKDTGMVRKLPNTKMYVLSELGKITQPVLTAKPWLLNKENKALMRYLRSLDCGELE
jgi:hypothetical protein